MPLLFQIALCLAVGLVAGIVSSMPPGPTEFWIARRVLSSSDKPPRIHFFLIGVIACDITYAAVAFWGYYGALQKSGLSFVFSAVGSSALILLGLYDFWRFRAQPSLSVEAIRSQKKESAVDDIANGVFLCGFNVAFIFFWLLVAAMLPGLGVKAHLAQNLAVLCGIALGDWIWYKAFAWFVGKGRHRLSPRWFHWLQQGFSLALSLFGAIALHEILNP